MKPIEKARAELDASKVKSEDEPDEFNAMKIITKAMAFKKNMKKMGLLRGRAKCPFCENGYWHGRLAGPKQHLHMYCDGCTIQLME